MRKIGFMYVAAILIMLLCACTSTNTKVSSNTGPSVFCEETAAADVTNKELRFSEHFTVEEIKLPKAGDKQIYGAVFAPDGSIYVNLSRSFAIYDKQQRLTKMIENNVGEFNHSITCDHIGNIYVGGNNNEDDNFIRVYSADGKLLKTYNNLFTTQGLAIIRQIVIDKTGNIYVLIKYGSIGRWSIAVLNPDGQVIKELTDGIVSPRSIMVDQSGDFYAGCWYDNRPNLDEPRLYRFTDISEMKYTCLDEYTDYVAVATEGICVMDKNGILYSRGKAYYDNFNKSCEINPTGFDFSYHSLAGWTKDNNGNAVFWLYLIMSSDGSGESIKYNCNLYRAKLK